jgi:hypothetical protein
VGLMMQRYGLIGMSEFTFRFSVMVRRRRRKAYSEAGDRRRAVKADDDVCPKGFSSGSMFLQRPAHVLNS